MKKLELIFENEDGKQATYSLDHPIEPADSEAVNAVMGEMIEEDLFATSGGSLVKKKSARIVERTVSEVEIN